MKVAAVCLLIATAAWAGWREDAGPYIAADTGRSVAWLNEPVAWQTNEVVTVTPRNESEWGWWYWVKVTCGEKYGYAPTASLAEIQSKMIAAQAADPSNALIVTDALTAKQVWEQFGSKVPWTEPVATTNTTTELTPSRYRWQDYGFEKAPTAKDIR